MQVEKHFTEISELIKQVRNKTLSIINHADYLNATSPDLKGFSSQNLWRMKQFY